MKAKTDKWDIKLKIVCKETMNRMKRQGTSLVGQWLRLRASTAGGTGSIPGQGTRTLRAARCGQKKKKNEKATYEMEKKNVCKPAMYLIRG